MTAAATSSNAEQWHIAPQCDRKLAELESDTARRQLEAYQAKQLDTQRGRLGDGMAPQPQQPTVIATHVVDLRPLVEWWQSQEQRLRDQVAVERTAASSAREALAACEERSRMLTSQLELGRLALDHAKRCAEKTQQPGFDYEKLLHEQAEKWNHTAAGYVRQIKNLEKRAQRAEDKLGKAHCERDAALERVVEARAQLELSKMALDQSRMAAEEGMLEHDRMLRELEQANEARLAALGEANRYAAERGGALADLECERARFERSLSELRSSATEQTVSLVPGSVPAVLEAYRLITGHEPRHIINSASAPGWVDRAWPRSALPSPALAELYRAAHELLKWLDQHAPGGKP